MNSIKRLREAAKVRQEELAEVCNVDRSTVSKWETGVQYPRLDKLQIIAKYFKCTVDDLLSEKNTA